MKISNYLIDKKSNKSKLFLKIFIPIMFIAVIIVFLTFYGLSTGNLYIGIDSSSESKNIAIDIKPNSTKNEKKLTLYDTSPNSPGDFYLINSRLEEITKNDGKYDGDLKDNLIGVNFYIRNLNHNLTVDLRYSAIVTNNNDEEAKLKTWNMLFIVDGNYYLYHNSEYDKTRYPDNYIVKDYVEGISPLEGLIHDLKAGEEKRISFIIWNIGYENMAPEKFKFRIYFQATNSQGVIV